MTDVLGLPPTRSQKPIYLHTAYLVRQEIRYYNEAVNKYLPWSGDDIRVRFSTEPTGYDTNGYPSTLFGPYTLVESGDEGVFQYPVPADQIMQYLGALVGQTIYQIVEGSYGSTYYDLTDVQPLLVVDPYAPLPA